MQSTTQALNRLELLHTLKKVEPALATKDLIPVFTCFSFNGETVTAYDDVVALRVPCAFPFTGGLSGRTLLDFLAAARSKEVSFEQQEGETKGELALELKTGRARLRLPIVPADDFVFKFPSVKNADALAIGDDTSFVEALKRASSSMGIDPSHPWRFGVTIRAQNEHVIFYSTDNMSAGKVVMVQNGLGGFRSCILPPRFVELLIALSAKDICKTLYLGDGWAQADFESKLRLMSRTVNKVEVKAYEKLFGSVDEKAEDVALPKSFAQALTRALVVLGALPDKAMLMTVKEGKLRLNSISALGEVNDTLKAAGHPDTTITCSPEQLRKALPFVSQFRIFDSCVRFRSDTFTHLVASFVK